MNIMYTVHNIIDSWIIIKSTYILLCPCNRRRENFANVGTSVMRQLYLMLSQGIQLLEKLYFALWLQPLWPNSGTRISLIDIPTFSK